VHWQTVYMTNRKQQTHAWDEKTHGVAWGTDGEYQGSVVWGFCGIPTGFSVGMGWVWNGY